MVSWQGERPDKGEPVSFYVVMDMVTTEQIREWIKAGELWRFYKTSEWMKLKRKILKENHFECAECRKLGKVTRWDLDKDGVKHTLSTVHHVMRVRDHPELALSRTYRDRETGEEKVNLVPVCKSCHNRLHPEKIASRTEKDPDAYTNEERW